MKKNQKKTSLLLLAALSACSQPAERLKPDIGALSTWPSSPEKSSKKTPVVTWATLVQDKHLKHLIQTALERNRDLKRLTAILQEARIQRTFTRADLLPQVAMNASASRGNRGLQTQNNVMDLADLKFDASWDLDLFGARQHRDEAQQHTILSKEFALEAAQRSLVAEIARTYNLILQHHNTIAQQREQLRFLKERMDLATDRLRAGLDNEVPLQQLTQSLKSLEQEYTQTQAQQKQLLATLGTLVGEPCYDLMGSIPYGTTLELPEIFILGEPLVTITKRPDIQQVEQELLATTKLKAASLADTYPQLSLTGLLGLQDTSSSPFQRLWSGGANLFFPLLDFGRLDAYVDLADAHQQQALYIYEQAVLDAYTDIQKSLEAFLSEKKRLQFLDETIQNQKEILTLTDQRYQNGVGTYDAVLADRVALFNLLKDRVQRQASVNEALLALSKALGIPLT